MTPDLPLLEKICTIPVPDDYGGRCAFTDNGARLLHVLRSGYHLHEGVGGSLLLSELRVFRDKIEAATFSPDGAWLAVGTAASFDRGIALHQLGRPSREPIVPRQARSLRFDERATRVICTNGSRGAWLLRVPDCAQLAFLTLHQIAHSPGPILLDADLTASGERVITAGSDGELVLWDADRGAPIARHRVEEDGVLLSVRLARDGVHCAVHSNHGVSLLRVDGDRLELCWRAVPDRPPATDWIPPPQAIEWIGDRHLGTIIWEQAPEGPYLFRSEPFLYLWEIGSDKPIVRALLPKFSTLAGSRGVPRLSLSWQGSIEIYDLKLDRERETERP